MNTTTILEGMRSLPDSGGVAVMAALDEAARGNLDSVPGLLENAATNLRTEGYGEAED